MALASVAIVGGYALRRAGVAEAVRQAEQLATVETRTAIAPMVTDALGRGDAAAVAAFDRFVKERLLGDRVVRVKLWDAAGQIRYADDPRLIGKRFPLSADGRAVLRTGAPHAELSGLEAAENTLEREAGELLEVYERVLTPSGQPLLFELYLRLDSVLASGRRIGQAFLPAFLTGLLVLYLLQIPLARALTRRIRRSQAEAEALHRKVLAAADDERRRVAGALHDGPVQTLTGLAYTLSALAGQLRPAVPAELAGRLAAAAGTSRQGVAELRSLLVDIYPANLAETGLRAALDQLLAPLAGRGIAVTMDAPDWPDLPVLPNETALVLYRTAQEALRNVVSHAGASEVRMSLSAVDWAVDWTGDRAGDWAGARGVQLSIADNGAGFDPGRPAPDNRPRFGLRMLDDLVEAAGGRLAVASAPGAGTRLTVEVPIP